VIGLASQRKKHDILMDVTHIFLLGFISSLSQLAWDKGYDVAVVEARELFSSVTSNNI
jgi:hypothetical protein